MWDNIDSFEEGQLKVKRSVSSPGQRGVLAKGGEIGWGDTWANIHKDIAVDIISDSAGQTIDSKTTPLPLGLSRGGVVGAVREGSCWF